MFDDNKGYRKSYYLKVLFGDGLPKLEINTENKTLISSKKDYVNTEIKLTNTPEEGPLFAIGKIRGRGNYTWNYQKKPYLLKLPQKTSILDLPANKDWVLLAEYNDRSFLRTAYMCEVSRAVNMEYTVNYKHITLYINGEYQGIYVLTDKVERSENRIKIEDDGYIIEDDNYYQNEKVFFVTTPSISKGISFKYPDSDDITIGDDNFAFIQDYMNNLEYSLLKLESNPKDIDFLKYIDLESFAKWYIVAELTKNLDPNLYYVLPSKKAKLKMYPMWDAEWSLGLGAIGWGAEDNIDVLANATYWDNKKFFKYLLSSPVFILAIKKEWEHFINYAYPIKSIIRDKERLLRIATSRNYDRWNNDNFKSTVNICFENWEDEVSWVNSFYEKRLNFLNIHIRSLEQ